MESGPIRIKCPVCKDPLDRHWAHGDKPLITFINGTPVHSGHCESEALLKSNRTRVTGFEPMPLDVSGDRVPLKLTTERWAE